ncbi:MAG: YidH family protein [Marmoricola sp.]
MSRTRWPGWVYDTGDEPDYRFSFANERTFLAWIRTALALIAGGVGLDAITLPISTALQTVLAALLVLLGVLCAAASWLRWAAAERAMRRATPLPSLYLGVIVTVTVVVIAVAILATVI